jgi:flavin-dependent dehydrogenase
MYSAWGRPELYSNDFVFHPQGSGWHIDRSRFDAMLAEAARVAGSAVYAGTTPVGIEEIDEGWNVSVRSAGGILNLKARFLVDATGRSACVARRMGAQRFRLDRGVAVTRCYQLPPGQVPDSFTLVEASPNGWWYSALLPYNQMAVQFITDPEFRLQTEMPEHTAARLRGSSCVTGPKVYSASSGYLDRVAGHKWLALGDAASTWDPLSAQGIAKALRSGLAAANAVPRHFAGEGDAITDYAAEARNNFTRYAKARQHYYGLEKRWPASLFWQRRQALHI